MCHKDAWSVWLLGTEWEHNELLPDLLLAWQSSCSRQIPQRGVQTWFICAGTYVEPISKSRCNTETSKGASRSRWLPSLASKHIFYIERQQKQGYTSNILKYFNDMTAVIYFSQGEIALQLSSNTNVPSGLTHPNLINYICNRFKLDPKHKWLLHLY